jgi:hypothetical protein
MLLGRLLHCVLVPRVAGVLCAPVRCCGCCAVLFEGTSAVDAGLRVCWCSVAVIHWYAEVQVCLVLVCGAVCGERCLLAGGVRCVLFSCGPVCAGVHRCWCASVIVSVLAGVLECCLLCFGVVCVLRC